MPKKADHGPFRSRGPDPEKLDPTPVAMPIGYKRPSPLADLIANMVRDEIERERGEEYESIEEAEDFEPEDEAVLDLSPYTLNDLEEERPIPPEVFSPPEEPVTEDPDPPEPKVVEESQAG